ncbi:MAG: methyltransferase, partial [Nitrososphaerales archaeon]
MGKRLWTEVERYFDGMLLPADPVMDAVLKASSSAGLPPINVTPSQGRLLWLLARVQASRRVLEIGTLGGY